MPAYQHKQGNLLAFMEAAYGAGDKERRILRHLYSHSGIETRYSVIPDFTLPQHQWEFFPRTSDLEPFPGLDHRMDWFARHALPLSVASAARCVDGVVAREDITHLITVSCTGMSAPGLELQLLEAMGLNANISRTAVNFMGCYAAIHGLKMAADIANANKEAKVLVVCTELCSLHFQKVFTQDAITAPLLFADGSAAVLVCGDGDEHKGIRLDSFYAEVMKDAKDSMTWKLSSMGFVMTLASDVPDIFRADIGQLKDRALARAGIGQDEIKHWCIHPGGKRILEAITMGLSLPGDALTASYKILRDYGNMSSATVLFVLHEMWQNIPPGERVFTAAFGPGLTMESVVMTME